MPTVDDVIQRLLPRGTSPEHKWRSCPAWPPDLFAVTTKLIELSGCYSAPPYSSGWNPASWFYKEPELKEIIDLGEAWRNGRTKPIGAPPARVQELWNELQDQNSHDVGDEKSWQTVALKLMLIADEASRGMGFTNEEGTSMLADLVFKEHRPVKEENVVKKLQQLPHSLCILVPKEEVCVQPKSVFPTVGCTLRSLSHHLALLPPAQIVRTSWNIGGGNVEASEKPVNLLVVPFPYKIPGTAFQAVPWSSQAQKPLGFACPDFFMVKQDWLPADTCSDGSQEFVAFVEVLLQEASKEVGAIHGIVLPELALNRQLLATLVEEVKTRSTFSSVEFLISGVANHDSSPKNIAFGALYRREKGRKHTYLDWEQSKHHRWRLNRSQIRRYHLGHVLDPERGWWEQIDIHGRECHFYEFRPGASLAVLVCEDLARIEPVQQVVRAIGPNFMIALLMDGPQLKRRWPNQYATVMADDPGSAVLTLTCVGMLERSVMPGEKASREIALWKEPYGETRELSLPSGDHALALTLTLRNTELRSFDRRSNLNATRQLRLAGVRPVRHPDPANWIVG